MLLHAKVCQEAETMDSEMSESGWTMYLDQCVDSCSDKYTTSQFDIEQQQKECSKFTEIVERYPIYKYWASSITGKEESSLASDASSGPQKLHLPVQDTEFEQGRQIAGSHSSYLSLAIREREAYVDRAGDSEYIASCSYPSLAIRERDAHVDMASRKNEFRRLKNDENDDLLLQDTATSPVHSPEAEAVNML